MVPNVVRFPQVASMDQRLSTSHGAKIHFSPTCRRKDSFVSLRESELHTMLLQRSVLIFYMLSMFATLTHAQVEIDQSFTIEEYVNDLLLGDGVSASNITLIGDPIQLAKLTEGSGNFSVESGLVLSCGDPNRLMDCGGDANPTGLGDAFDDPDLLEVANSVPPLIGESFTVSSVNDGCVLEFDFEAGGDSISFNYVFGSDEYLNYVNTQYNDIFAFFLSGPGISGPYAAPAGFPDGAINIAQVPNSDPLLPVTISSVNNVTNPEYYIDNQNPAPGDVCINGYTTTFTAAAAVQCGETYHIKLAIADGSDTFLESIVVLEAGSFSSNAVELQAEAVPLRRAVWRTSSRTRTPSGCPTTSNTPTARASRSQIGTPTTTSR